MSVNVEICWIECYSCGVLIGMPVQLNRNLKESHKAFYCVNGHSQSYTGPTEAERLAKQLAEAKAQVDRERTRLGDRETEMRILQNQLSASKGQITKLRKKIEGEE